MRALVVGGSGAVGLALCRRLTEIDTTVVASYRTRPAELSGVKWFGWRTSDPFPASKISVEPFDIVAYLVGTHSSKLPVVKTARAEFEALLDINALGFVDMLSELVASDRLSAGASVVALSSSATGVVRPLNGAYSASKSALEAIALCAAVEMAAGVRVNVVAPSLIESPMGDASLRAKGITDLAHYKASLPGGRPHSPEEVADLVFTVLCSAGFARVSGELIRMELK